MAYLVKGVLALLGVVETTSVIFYLSFRHETFLPCILGVNQSRVRSQPVFTYKNMGVLLHFIIIMIIITTS